MASTARRGTRRPPEAEAGGVSGPDEPTPGSARALNTRLSRRDALIGLGLAAGIAGGAWAIGGRAGFDQIGKGGVNQRLLPKVGERAPDFMALDATERGVWLHDFAGKPVWLSF